MGRNKPDKGAFLWKSRWVSICSMHYDYKSDCHICNTGCWSNVWLSKISSGVFKVSPKFWVWWNNTGFARKHFMTHKFLQSTFPKLRNGTK